MNPTRIPYVSLNTEQMLWRDGASNMLRYASSGFDDLLAMPGATLYMDQTYDPAPLMELDADKGDLHNTRLVWRALKGLTPALARENRLWTRICHSEALTYARDRWWKGASAAEAESLTQLHCFARTRNQCRDDNAIARLWWSAFAAYRLHPSDFEGALAALLKKADTRAAIVERPWTGARVPIGREIIRALQNDEWLSGKDDNLREVMKDLNVSAAGLAIEACVGNEAEALILDAVDHAKAGSAAKVVKKSANSKGNIKPNKRIKRKGKRQGKRGSS